MSATRTTPRRIGPLLVSWLRGVDTKRIHITLPLQAATKRGDL